MNLSEKRTKMSKIIITETRLESVKYFYEYEGTIEKAKEWFVDNGIYYYSDNFTDINNWKITIAETWNMDIEDVEWFATEQERDQMFSGNENE